MDKKFEQEIRNLLSFMMTSARELPDDPQIYGPLRLIDTAGKLIKILKDSSLINKDEFSVIEQKIKEAKEFCMIDQKDFYLLIDNIIESLLNYYI
jgi:hypothetical protein